MNPYEKVQKAIRSIRERTDFVPEVAIILGSGLGALADEVKDAVVISAAEIEGFPASTVSGHAGRLVFGTLEGKKVAVQQGRIHYYEGYEMSDVVLPVRLLCALGAEVVILTNAAGGINEEYRPGDFMAIKGQIAQFVPSPLRGPNDEAFGTRFPDMSSIYSPRLIALAKESAKEAGATMREGVYLQAGGPNYESPEEVRAFKILGADAVGMSTAVESIAVKHMGKEVLGISLITNPAAGVSEKPLSHEEVTAAGDRAKNAFAKIIRGVVRKL